MCVLIGRFTQFNYGSVRNPDCYHSNSTKPVDYVIFLRKRQTFLSPRSKVKKLTSKWLLIRQKSKSNVKQPFRCQDFDALPTPRLQTKETIGCWNFHFHCCVVLQIHRKVKKHKYVHASQNHTYSRQVGVEIKLKKRAWSQTKRAGSARKLIRKQWRAFNR